MKTIYLLDAGDGYSTSLVAACEDRDEAEALAAAANGTGDFSYDLTIIEVPVHEAGTNPMPVPYFTVSAMLDEPGEKISSSYSVDGRDRFSDEPLVKARLEIVEYDGGSMKGRVRVEAVGTSADKCMAVVRREVLKQKADREVG